MTNKIIVPVDLTPASKNAFLYAVNLASELDLEVELLPIIDPHSYLERSLKENFYGFKKQSLPMAIASFYCEDFPKEELSSFDVNVKINMLPYTLIFNQSFRERKDIDLVVFGIEKNNRYSFRMSQDFVLELAERLDSNALFIPAERSFMRVDNILFIADYDFADISLLKQWQEVGENAEAEFHFIFGTGINPIFESKEEIYDKLFAQGIADISFNLSFFSDFELEDAIKSYVDKVDIDMIVINKPGLSDLLKPGLGASDLNRPVLIPNPVVLLKIR